MAGFVICDASPVIGLARVDGLGWLKSLFGEVWIPGQVEGELLAGRETPDRPRIRAALTAGTLKVWPESINVAAESDLDAGETACIHLARAHPGSLLLIDERAGRTVARQHGITIAGTAAVIGQACLRGLIPSARDVFGQLLQGDFRIAPEVIRAVLEWVGEW